MPKNKTDTEAIDGKENVSAAEKFERMLDSFDETDENAERRIDVLEDMLDIMNEQ